MSRAFGRFNRWSSAYSTLCALFVLSSAAGAQTAPPPGATPSPSVPPPAPAAAAPAPTPAPAVPAAPAPAAAPAEATAAAPAAAPADLDTSINEQLVEDVAGKASGEDYKLDIYGFADFTYSHLLNKFYFDPPYHSFAIGNLNVYLASDLGSKWHSLAEVRFSYLPNGVYAFGQTGTSTRTDTTVGDYTDIGRPTRWGGIMIERAWLEYAAHPLLTIRAGHWLTPYGIWNVDHGSPTVIGVQRPYIVGDALFPQSQTGFELYGSHDFSAFELGYHLTLSNGRGPIDTYQDLDNNKAIGARLVAHADTPAGSITIGGSFYEGRYTDRSQALVPNGSGGFELSNPVVNQFQEVSWAADLKWELSGFLLQSEFIVNQMKYSDVRPPLTAVNPPAFTPDTQRWGVYGLAGYRFDFLGTMPYAELEYYDSGPSLLRKTADVVAGLNVRPTGRVVLKGQWIYAWFPGAGSFLPPDSHYHVLNFQAAWSF